MNTRPAIRTAAIIAADIPIASSVAPQSVGLVSPIGAGQTQKLRYWIPFNVGATGGIRAIVAVPAAGTLFLATVTLFNNVAPSITTSVQTASAAFTNAVANAGLSWLLIEATVVNGATAGNVDLQIAQNTSDVLTLTVKQGGFVDVTKI